MDELIQLVLAHKWLAVSVLVIGATVRATKTGALDALVPAAARPWIALGLGVVSGVLDAVAGGEAWLPAILSGLGAAVIAIAGHQVAVESLAGGVEVGRGWTRALATRLSGKGQGDQS